MRRVKTILYIFAAGTMLVSSSGCKKYLDVNKNLNSPTAVPVSVLLTTSQRTIAGGLALGSGLSAGLSAYVHQLTGRAAFDNYSLTGSSGIVANSWDALYRAITNLDVIIAQGTSESRMTYVGIAKILRAYTFSQMVDVWGDIPYSEFNQFKTGIKQPKFDDDATIYPKLFAQIDAGVADINNTVLNPSTPGADDVIYGGNKTRWIKAANTIKLKLYTQVRLVQNVSTQVNALLASPNTLINFHNENFMVPFGVFGAASDDRHPGYSDYTGTQRGSQLISHWLYENMRGVGLEYRTGVIDPRIPYYMYRQKTATGAPENNTEYRDGGFITILFGSKGPYKDGSNSNTYTLWGLFPIGGRYDDGAGTSISGTGLSSAANAGTGAAPHRMITFADRLYLEAELQQAGVATSGTVRTTFHNALTQSFRQVDSIVINFIKTINQTIPSLSAQAASATYITTIMAQYDAANATDKMEHIMTQKWLSNIGNGVDQYTDYRRTGFPVIFDPSNPFHAPGGFVTNPSGQTAARIPVSNTTVYPQSLPWPQYERELNANAPPQKSPDTYKIFWKP